MTITSHTVPTTAVRLLGIDHRRTSVVIQNTHASAYLYISDKSDVSTLSLRIQAGASISMKIPEDDPTTEWWAIASASCTVVVYQGYSKVLEIWRKP